MMSQKSKTLSSVVLTILISVSCEAYAVDTCGSGRSAVSIEGPQPQTSNLLQRLPVDAGLRLERGSFDNERVQYVASLSAKFGGWQLVHIETTWGHGCRSTKRLHVFTGTGQYVGHWYGVESPRHVVGDWFTFPSGDDLVLNAWSPPPAINVDGEVHEFETYAGFVLPMRSEEEANLIAFARAEDAYYRLVGSGYTELCPVLSPQAQAHREAIRDALAQIDASGLEDPLGATPLVYAVIADDLPALRRFADMGYPLDRKNGLLLFDAAMFASEPILDDLLRRGIVIDATDENGATALMVAAQQQRPDFVRFLLERGADPNIRDHRGGTALAYGLACGYTGSAQALLQAGAEVDAKVLEIAEKTGAVQQVRDFRR